VAHRVEAWHLDSEPMSLPLLASIGWPVLDRFRFGSRFAISPHGVFIAIGFMMGVWLLGRIGPERGIPTEEVNAIGFWALIGAIIGARFFYVIAHLSEFNSFVDTLKIYNGGISLLGGIAGAVLINVPRLRRHGYRFFKAADCVAPALAFGIAIGRIGDLIIGDHLGKPTSWWLAWTYHGGNLAPPWVCTNGVCQATLQDGSLEVVTRTGAKLLDTHGHLVAQGVGVHQTALYDMILAWALFALLWTMQKRPRREGILTLTFGLWYGLERILEDSLRIDKRFGPFTGSQWTALAVVIVSAGLLFWWAFHPLPPGGSYGGEEGAVAASAEPVGEPAED
jgi:phosphatidylglycerol---prolipoprotein diacylglyceryl transferase